MKIHYMKLNPEPFEKIISGKKIIELRLFDDKRQAVEIGDKIIFTNTGNTNRTLQVEVTSIVQAQTFKDLFKIVSLAGCGYDEEEICDINYPDMFEYYSWGKQQKYGVVGFRFQMDEHPALDKKLLPYAEVENKIFSFIDKEEEYKKNILEWIHFYKENANIPGNKKIFLSLEEILTIFDDSIKDYVWDLSFELRWKLEEAGYDVEELGYHAFYQYYDDTYDRTFTGEVFPIREWWNGVRLAVIRFYCGGGQLLSYYYKITIPTTFDYYGDE